MSRATVAVITLFLALLASSGGAVFAEDPVPKVDAKLIAPTTAIHPGRPFTVGLHQKITPQWHTYWNNPGDSGEPTRLTWKLPEGFAASAINWPIPEAIPVEPLMNYGYSGEVLLPLVISPPATIHGRTAVLEAHAEWLVCEKICIPEQKTVRLALEIAPLGSPLPSSPHAAMFEATHRMQPVDIDWPVRVEAVGEHLQLSIAATDLEPNKVKGAWFFPDT